MMDDQDDAVLDNSLSTEEEGYSSSKSGFSSTKEKEKEEVEKNT